MGKKIWRYSAFTNNSEAVIEFCKNHGFKIYRLNSGYQLRIENVVDVYPVRRRYHVLRTGERGYWKNNDRLAGLVMQELKHAKEPPKSEEPENQGTNISYKYDKDSEITTKEQIDEIIATSRRRKLRYKIIERIITWLNSLLKN